MGLYKRGGVYYARVKTNAGKWVPKSLGTSDPVVAKVKYREHERREADPSYKAANETSLADASDLFISSRRVKGCVEDTIKMYEKHIGHLARLWGEDLPIAHIDAPRVDKYLATRLGEGTGRNTLGKELTTIRGLLKAAKRAKKWPFDLDEVMPSEWSNDYVPRKIALTPEQVTKLVKVLAEPRRWTDKLGRSYERERDTLNSVAMVAFMVGTGARLAEARRATRSQINVKTGLVYFIITKTRRKGKREKHVPITSATRTLLEQVLAATADRKTGPMFDPWTNVVRDLEIACEAAGVPKVTPNDLRRTFSNWLVNSDVPLNFVADAMGHVDSRMVEKVYGRLRPEQLRDRILEHVH